MPGKRVFERVPERNRELVRRLIRGLFGHNFYLSIGPEGRITRSTLVIHKEFAANKITDLHIWIIRPDGGFENQGSLLFNREALYRPITSVYTEVPEILTLTDTLTTQTLARITK